MERPEIGNLRTVLIEEVLRETTVADLLRIVNQFLHHGTHLILGILLFLIRFLEHTIVVLSADKN